MYFNIFIATEKKNQRSSYASQKAKLIKSKSNPMLKQHTETKKKRNDKLNWFHQHHTFTFDKKCKAKVKNSSILCKKGR